MPRATQDSATPHSHFGYGALIPCGAPFQALPLVLQVRPARSYYPRGADKLPAGFGLFPVRSPLLGESLLFSLPGGTKMFQFPPFASRGVKPGMTALQAAGLSHSETRGSKVTCTSPRIIAAYRVLHRLREPRHPPCALSYFATHTTPALILTFRQRGRRERAGRPYFQLYSLLIESTFCYYSLACPTCQRSIRPKQGREVENIGLEPMTSCMPCKRSSQLS